MSFPVVMLGASDGGSQRPPAFAPLLFWFAADGAENCRMWSDVAATVPAIAGGAVAAITGDEGIVYTQATSSQRPMRSVDGRGLVFNKAVGSNLTIASGSSLPPAVSSRSAYTIMAAAEFVATGTILLFEGGSSNGVTLSWPAADEALFYVETHGTDNDCLRTGVGTDERNVLVARLTAWSGISAMHLDTDAGETIAGFSGGAPAAFNTGAIGRRGSGGPGFTYASMILHELAIYDGALTDPQVAELIAYTKDRWGLA